MPSDELPGLKAAQEMARKYAGTEKHAGNAREAHALERLALLVGARIRQIGVETTAEVPVIAVCASCGGPALCANCGGPL